MGNGVKEFVIGENDSEFMEEIKTRLNLKPGDTAELCSEAKRYVIIGKSTPVCFTCGAENDLHTLGNNMILCRKCLKAMCSVTLDGISNNELKDIKKNL